MQKTLIYLLLVLFTIQCTQTESAESKTEDKMSTVNSTESSKIKDSEITLDGTKSVPTEKLKDGEFKSYFPEGQLKVSGFVEQGKRVGNWVSYFPNGNKQSENNYVNGLLSGKTVALYPNGQIMYIGYYNNGTPDGEWLYFDESGKMTKHLNYKAGVPYDLPLD